MKLIPGLLKRMQYLILVQCTYIFIVTPRPSNNCTKKKFFKVYLTIQILIYVWPDYLFNLALLKYVLIVKGAQVRIIRI